MRESKDILEDIESLPLGDPEIDHILLDKYTLETLKLCLVVIEREWGECENTNLLHHLIQKRETIEELWYA